MTPKKQYYENTAKTIIANLEKRQMKGWYCQDSAAAVKKVLELVPEQSSVTWGGTMTMEECGLMDALKKGSYTLIDRLAAKTPEEKKALFAKAVCADYFFMSANAITLNGELINVDGAGNRVACLCSGPDNVIVLAGMNKVVTTLEDGHKKYSRSHQYPAAEQKDPLFRYGKMRRLPVPGLHLQPNRSYQKIPHPRQNKGNSYRGRAGLLILCLLT